MQTAPKHPDWLSYLPSLVAGFVVVLVGFTSTVVVVFQAATAAGANPDQVNSWLAALCIGMGSLSIVMSVYYRVPVLFAWSTPAAALLVSSLAGVPLSDAIGAFIFSATLIAICGFTGWFEKIIDHIPTAITSALLAGVLFHFGVDVFSSMKLNPSLIFPMFAVYLLGKKIFPRYAVILVLGFGIFMAETLGLLHFNDFHLELSSLIFVAPTFSVSACIGVGLPIFIVTMASQNVTGVAIMKASGFKVPVSPLIGWSGLANLVLAPFGAFAINLAAITAAIAMGPECNPDPKKRYIAGVFSGLLYIVLGVCGATVGSYFQAFPKELVMTIAGIALFGTIGNGLAHALKDEYSREAALMTLLVTVSGVSFLGISSAFWGVVAGGSVLLIVNKRWRSK